METVLRTAVGVLLAGGLAACTCGTSSSHFSAPSCEHGCGDVCANKYTHEAYDDGNVIIKYEDNKYHYRPYHPGCYYKPYFYHVPYSDFYQY